MSTPRFALVEAEIHAISAEDGRLIARLKPRQTRIVQFELVEEGILVREDYFGFRGSNVYFVGLDFSERWTAELPAAQDGYCNQVRVTEKGYACSTWEGYACVLAQNSGRLISCTFSK